MRPMTASAARTDCETFAARRRRRLNAFRPAFRLDIARLTLEWPKVEDLADSFPALLFALTTGYGTASSREAAFKLIDAGAPLKDIAGVLGLPLWLRRVPGEALLRPLPPLPADPDFTATMLNRMPDGPADCALWLERFLAAYSLVGRDFAVWVAREPRLLPPATNDESWQWMLAWGWTSRTPRSAGHALLRTAWNPALSWKRAHEEIGIWRKRVDLVGALADPHRDPWFADGHVLGYEFVALTTVTSMLAESLAMENCLDQYAAHLSYGRIRVFSVRREGRPVADVELALRSDETTMPTISQVRGARNRRASPSVWQAVHAWLGAQTFRPLASAPTPQAASRDALKSFWAPYVRAIEAQGLPNRLVTHLAGAGTKRNTRSRSQSLAVALREAIAPPLPRRVPAAE